MQAHGSAVFRGRGGCCLEPAIQGEGDSVGGNEIPTNEADFRKG